MTIKNFIPKIWDSALQVETDKLSIAAGLASRKFEGQLKRGNTIELHDIVPVTIKDYKANNRTTTPDAVAGTKREFSIDQEKNYDFLIDDIDEAQAAMAVEPAFLKSAANGLAQDADKFLWGKVFSEAGSNLDATNGATTPEEVYNLFRAANKRLRQNEITDEGRLAVLNSEAYDILLDYTGKFADAGEFGTNQAVVNATVGRLLGFNILVSDRLPVIDRPAAAFGTFNALAYVSQLKSAEALRAENSFSDRLRGLHVYGGFVTEPKGLITYTQPVTP